MNSTVAGDISFNLELLCTKTNQTQHGIVAFPENAPPATIADIKSRVEEDFNIPVCVQSLSYEAYCLSDGTSLDAARIRSGDTFLVTYAAEGDCPEIRKVVRWLELVREYLGVEDPSLSSPMSSDFEELIELGIREELIENLAFKYLFPWLDAKKYTNKLYFVQFGGLDVIMDVFTLIHQHPWMQCMLHLKYVEYGILRVLWNLSETFQLRRLIMRHNGLQLCIKSLLRQKLEERESIQDKTNVASHRTNSWVLVETIGAALGLLCNLSELPECHIEIASNEACLDQLTCISLTPSVRIMSVQLVATLFLCVAYTPSTHPFLAKPLLIRRLMEASDTDRKFTEDNQDERTRDILMLRYFTQVFLAQVLLASPQHVPENFKQSIHDFMEDFLKNATHQIVMAGEVKHWYVWSTFLPYIRLLYLPGASQVHRRSEIMRRLHMLSLQTILLSLQNMLGRDNHREVLLQEGLEDYITCVPSYVPGSLRDQARELVRIVGSGVQLQPPRLVNLVKANLAKNHFGLERVVHLSVGEIINEALPSS